MPYAKNAELPKSVRDSYSAKEQRAFRKAFNAAVADGKDESAAMRIAHAAAKRAGSGTANQQRAFLEVFERNLDRLGVELALNLACNAAERRRVTTPPETSELISDSVEVTRDMLRSAGVERWGTSSYVADFGDSYAVFEVWDSDEERIYKVGYSVTDGKVVLADESKEVERRRQVRYVEKARERTPPASPETPSLRPERAFLYQTPERAFITARASVAEFAALAGLANPEFMYLAGRFVGAEEANRNNAYWSLDDLSFGEPSVAYGPLNWLHDERQVIGAIADAKLVRPSPAEAASQAVIPHIAAASVMWKFLFPQHAQVVERASAEGTLWYSMECISDKVSCIDHECGEWSYPEFMGKQVICDHLRERSGRVHFKNPVFLGAAVIVPPVQPGWADANLEVIEVASRVAERAFAQVGDESLPASDFEKVVAQVVAFSRR